MVSPPDNVLHFGYIFFSFELLGCVIVLGIACLNLAVIGPTKLLNANLKCILITQSVAFILFVFVRSIMVVQKLLSNDPFEPANLFLQGILIFAGFFRRSLGHALIIERFIATVRANSYERFSKFYFNIALFSITFTIAFVNTVTNNKIWSLTISNLITQTLSTILSFVEYLFIIALGYYNRKRYISQIEEATLNNYHIGQRYQVSNNMKTAKQLSATFVCLFLENVFTNLIQIIFAFEWLKEEYQISLALAGYLWMDSILGAAIELTVMTHHPMLKQRFATLLKKICCCCRVKHNQIGNLPTNFVELSIDGNKNKDEEGTEHFKMLEHLWNKK